MLEKEEAALSTRKRVSVPVLTALRLRLRGALAGAGAEILFTRPGAEREREEVAAVTRGGGGRLVFCLDRREGFATK